MKNVAIIILFFLCAWLAWHYIANPAAPPRQSPIESAARETVILEAERITRKVDAMGVEHAIIDETEHSISQAGARASQDTVLINTIDSLVKQLGIERNQFKSYVRTQALVVDSLMEATKTDKGYEYRDRWVSLALDNSKDEDQAKFSFEYNAEVNMVQYWRRNWFLGRKRPYLDIWMSDPRARINGVSRLVIKPEAKRFGMSVQALSDYTAAGGLTAGFGATFRTGRLRIQGAYMNDFDGNWRPALRGSYDLIDW